MTEPPAAGDGAEEGKPNPLPAMGDGDDGSPNSLLGSDDVGGASGGGEEGGPNPLPDDGWEKAGAPPAVGAGDG
ncbi:MAG: hypothetical protein NZ699_17740 [Roseiflexus sp.]|nr:hypothetical protein [Roseiflexus sp.]MCS7290966.1 hypothetical protein [Roseiflexus sp.]MDW8147741.1 hypothetical protein [Roseiflexaceae bacterium]